MKIALVNTELINPTGYYKDWLKAFLEYENIEVDLYVTNKMGIIDSFRLIQKKYDLIVLLPSVYSNGLRLPKILRFLLFKIRKSPCAVFFVNEYKHAQRKINFINKFEIEYIVSQMPLDIANWLYSETKAKVISLPPALSSIEYDNIKEFENRKIDLGTRLHNVPFYLGSKDKFKVLEFAQCLSDDFVVDVKMTKGYEFKGNEWLEFLGDCKFTIAAQAGTSYLEKDDTSMKLIKKYLQNNADATFDEVYERFFKNYSHQISGQCITPRHFEAIKVKTCQILIEGRYNDILTPNVHYIELKNDLSNIDNVVEKMNDTEFCKSIIENAYTYVLDKHTYNNRIQEFLLEVKK